MSNSDTTTIVTSELNSYIERLERLDEEKKAINDDFKDVLLEMKSNGFDTKIVKKVLKIRKQDRAERIEEESILDVYLHALGIE